MDGGHHGLIGIGLRRARSRAFDPHHLPALFDQ
jgi:hypothetical protein